LERILLEVSPKNSKKAFSRTVDIKYDVIVKVELFGGGRDQ
jgi:hypothetical protein